MRVELVFSPAPRGVEARSLDLAEGATVADALAAGGLAARVAYEGLAVGVWGRRGPLERPLREGDRVEVYRPLEIDPKEARRLRGR